MSLSEKNDIKKSSESALLLLVVGYFELLGCHDSGIKKICQNVSKNFNNTDHININYTKNKRIYIAVSVYLGCQYPLMSGPRVSQHESNILKDHDKNENNSDCDTEYYFFERFEPVVGGLGMDMQDNNIERYRVYWIITRLCNTIIPNDLIHMIICFCGPWCNEFKSNILNEMEKKKLVDIFGWHLDTFEICIKQLYYSKSTQCGSCEQYIKSIHCAGPTVTILKTTSGHVFGGYVGRNIWHNAKHTIKFHDPTSLLFNITTDTVYPLKRTDEDAAVIQTHPRIFIEFGWNGDVVAGFVKEAGTIVMGYERSPFDSSSYQYYNGNPIHGQFGALDIEAIELLSLSRK